MRRLLAATFGCGLALSPSFAHAQVPGTPRSPVRLLGVRSADEPIQLARAQSGGAPMPMPMPGTPKPMAAPTGPMGGAPTQLGMPTPFGGGPTIGEYPGTPYPTVPGYPGVTLGPVYGAPPEQPHPTMAYPAGPEAYGGAMPQLEAPLYDGIYSQPTYGPYGGYGPAQAQPGFAGILGTCGPNCGVNRWSLSAEYLLWFTKSGQYPALLSTSSPAFNGILGSGDSRVILGNGSLGDNLHSGGRFGFARTLGCAGLWSVEGNVFVLANNSTDYLFDSTQYPVLARPFTNANQNVAFSEVLASPGLATGSALVNVETMLWGAELNLRRRLAGNACSRLDLIGGFRYMNLSEQLSVTETFVRTPNSPSSIGVPSAISGSVYDEIRTENHFVGGTVGLAYERQRGRWFTGLTAKVSLGQMDQQVSINGSQTIAFDTGAVGQYAGGLLAVPGANIGTYKQTTFAVVPELGFNVGYQVTRRMRAFVGYNFLYVNSVLRPGQQIDPTIDITRIPNFPVTGVTQLPLVKPSVPMKESDFFAQGVSFGLQWKW